MEHPSRTWVKRAPHEYHPWFVRSMILQPEMASQGMFERAFRWALPWSVSSYPGLRRGILAILSNGWTYSAIVHWRHDRARVPILAVSRLRDYIAGRCEVGMSLVSEMDKYIAEFERKPGGFTVVKDRDGDGSTRDARNRVGKRKSKTPTQP